MLGSKLKNAISQVLYLQGDKQSTSLEMTWWRVAETLAGDGKQLENIRLVGHAPITRCIRNSILSNGQESQLKC
jgi:hypothetical protein